MKLHYRQAGEGERVIILHGLFGMSDNWQSFSKSLSQHFEVIAPDLRNHGRSPHTSEFSYSVLAADIEALIHDLGDAPVHLIGHSLGGKVAMQVALSRPALVGRLIVIDIAPKQYEPKHDAIFDALLSVDLSAMDTRGEIEDTLMSALDDRTVVLFLMKSVKRDRKHGFSWRINLPVLTDAYPSINEAIQSDGTFDKPVLFVRGERSTYIRDEDLPGIRSLFPKARLVTIDGAGHWVHANAPEELLGVVQEFLGG